MLFKNVILIATLLTFISCAEYEGQPSIANPKMTVEEVQNFVNGLQFTGTLPSGQRIEFVPNEMLSTDSGPEFTDIENPNFSKSRSLNFDLGTVSNNSSVLTIFPYQVPQTISITFEYTLIITFGELEELYPFDVDIDPSEEHYVLGLALGSRFYDVEDLLEQGSAFYGITDFIQVVFDPRGFTNQVNGTYISEGDTSPFLLSGNYQYQGDVIKSEGVMDLVTFGGLYRVGDYSLLLED